MQIIVKLLSGKKAQIDIEGSDTIRRVKERVEEKASRSPPISRQEFHFLLFFSPPVFHSCHVYHKASPTQEGIPPPQQRLIFGGKAMADDKTAEDYNLKAGSIVHLVLALRGGQ